VALRQEGERFMGRRFIQHLADGEQIEEVYLVADKQLRANRNGNLYIQLELQDRTGSMTARLWNAGEPLFRSFEAGDFLSVKAKVQIFQGALQMILQHLEKIQPERAQLIDFLPHTEQDVNKLLERLRAPLLKLANPHLRALAECYLMDEAFMAAFSKAPAGVRVHHAYVGGLLEHVVAMLDIADRIAPLYPEVDRDLLLAGVFLHDTGKVRELAFDRSFGYTDEGQLLGHLAIGIEMLQAKAARVPDLTGEPFPPELLLRLKHLILSHHGSHEFGSPKVPMTPEAVALHAIDMLDTRIHICLREIKDDKSETNSWTPYNQAMQRRLFKGSRGAANGAPGPSTDQYD
jgi:3'-5' exoribonuclease